MPICEAVSFACSGFFISEPVAISINGMPSLSSLYLTKSFPSSCFLAASSSRQIIGIVTFPWEVSIKHLQLLRQFFGTQIRCFHQQLFFS
jgi:hypothetical protein